jgi:hypothetical protein
MVTPTMDPATEFHLLTDERAVYLTAIMAAHGMISYNYGLDRPVTG